MWRTAPENMTFVATIRPIATHTRNSLKTPTGRCAVIAFCAGTPPSIAAFMSGMDGVRQSRNKNPAAIANR